MGNVKIGGRPYGAREHLDWLEGEFRDDVFRPATEAGMQSRRDGAAWFDRSLDEIARGEVPLSGRPQALLQLVDLANRVARCLPENLKKLADPLLGGPLPELVIEGGGYLQVRDIDRLQNVCGYILRHVKGEPASRADRDFREDRLRRIDPSACYLVITGNAGAPTAIGAAYGRYPQHAAAGSHVAGPAGFGCATAGVVASVSDKGIIGDPFSPPGSPVRYQPRFTFSKEI